MIDPNAEHDCPHATNTLGMVQAYTPQAVSVIVPAYNVECYIIEALESVWHSTYRPIELIVVDDGSTDGTLDTLRNWVADIGILRDFEVILIEQANHGATAARNAGLRSCHGEFVHFLDADDTVVPPFYEIAVAALKADPDCGMVWTGWRNATQGMMRNQSEWCLENDANFHEGIIVDATPALGCASFYRRATILRVGGFVESIHLGDDVNYYLRVLMHGIKIRQMHNTLYIYRQLASQSSQLVNRDAADSFLRAIEFADYTWHNENFRLSQSRSRAIIGQFAAVYRASLFRALKSGHEDLVKRAFHGIYNYRAGFPVLQRFKLATLNLVTAMVSFGACRTLARAYYPGLC